jgi:hypothetical protein
LFINIRSGASVSQLLAVSLVPVGAFIRLVLSLREAIAAMEISS